MRPACTAEAAGGDCSAAPGIEETGLAGELASSMQAAATHGAIGIEPRLEGQGGQRGRPEPRLSYASGTRPARHQAYLIAPASSQELTERNGWPDSALPGASGAYR